MGGGIRKIKAIRWGAYYYSLVLIAYCCYAYRLYFFTCDMYKSSLRHIHDPVLSSLKMKGIRFFFCYVAICGLSGSKILFSHYLIKGTNFGKNVIDIKMCALIFHTNFVWNIHHLKKNWARYYHKFAYIFTESTCYFCQISVKLESSRHIFEQYSSTKFHKNQSTGSRVVPCGPDEANRIPRSCELA
jgi:hypothetical protein